MHHSSNISRPRTTKAIHRRNGRRVLARLALASSLVALPFLAMAQQASGPATLQDALSQIEALKKQVSDLENRVKGQIQQTTISNATSQVATPEGAVPKSTPSSAPAGSSWVKWNELTAGKSKFKLYGFLRLDGIYDDSRPGGNGSIY